MSLMAWVFFRARGYHPERVPAVGPVILAPNHFSFLDHFFLGVALRRKVHFMAKSQLFKPPMQSIFTHGGVFPVRRGFADEDAFITAVTVLDRGDTMAMYAEGGRSRTGEPAQEAPARHRPPRAAERRADRPGRDRRLHATCATGSALQFPKIRVYYGEPFAYERVEAPTREPGAGRRRRHLRGGARALRRGDQARLRRLLSGLGRAACPGPAARAARRRRAPRRRPRPRASCRR